MVYELLTCLYLSTLCTIHQYCLAPSAVIALHIIAQLYTLLICILLVCYMHCYSVYYTEYMYFSSIYYSSAICSTFQYIIYFPDALHLSSIAPLYALLCIIAVKYTFHLNSIALLCKHHSLVLWFCFMYYAVQNYSSDICTTQSSVLQHCYGRTYTLIRLSHKLRNIPLNPNLNT